MATNVQLAWLKTMVLPAQTTARSFGVPASVTLAQCTLESDWGRSQLARQAQNYFGVKAIQGEDYMEFPTHEVVKGRTVAELADFARYGTAVDSFFAHAHLLATLKRYKPCMDARTDIPTFCARLQSCGYSTSPTYATSLLGEIHCYGLTQYDVLPAPAQPAAGTQEKP